MSCHGMQKYPDSEYKPEEKFFLWFFIILVMGAMMMGCAVNRLGKCKAPHEGYSHKCELQKDHVSGHQFTSKQGIFLWYGKCPDSNCALERGHKGKHKKHPPGFHSKDWGECMIEW